MVQEWFWFALASAGLSAASTIAEKKSLFHVSAITFSLYVSLFLFIFSIPLLSFSTLPNISIEMLIVLFIKTLLASVSYLLLMNGIKKSELSSSLPLMILTPGLVAVSAYFLLGDTMNISQIAGMVLLISGLVLLLQSVNNGHQINFAFFIKSAGHRYMLAALALYTITSLLDKTLLAGYSFPLNNFLVFQHFFQLLVFVPLFLVSEKPAKAALSIKPVFIIIILAAVFTLAYRYTQFAALKTGNVALVLSVKRISVFIAIVVAGKMFHEKNLLKRTIATIIMLSGAFFIALS